jgi:D-alanine-D-alanine ligase-like ATP-grasp enzyme
MKKKKSSHTTIKNSFVSEIVCRVAPKIGAKVLMEPEYGFVGQITFKNGKRVLFRDRNFNINPLASSEIARDKGYADFFLKLYGYKTIEGQTFFSDDRNQRIKIKRSIHDGFNYAKTLGLPVILKPNNLSQGTLVTKVHNRREYYAVAKAILKRVPVMLVQKYYAGFDYRIVVLDKEVISAYQRVPLFVIGNGRSTVMNLLLQKQKYFGKTGRDTEIELDDFRITEKLKRQKLNFKSVPPRGQQIFLLDNANLSTGGDAIDVSEIIHPDFKRLAVKITKDMGLRMCGVDVITSSEISTPLKDYVIIEINSAPGLDNYASIGTKQKNRVDSLYLKVLIALESN